MKTLLIFTFLLILTVACQNKDDDEFNREQIPGEYTGDLIYWHSMHESGTTLISSDTSQGWVFKASIKRIGSNYIMSFDTSFIYKIPDLTIDITSTKSTGVYGITTLFGQAYSAINKEYTYNNQPSNYFSVSKYPQVVNCDLTLRSNDPDSTYFLQMLIHRIY